MSTLGKNHIRVGTTKGIDTRFSAAGRGAAEQVYVEIDPEDKTHPFVITFARGYDFGLQGRVTRQQATELRELLERALDEDKRWRGRG